MVKALFNRRLPNPLFSWRTIEVDKQKFYFPLCIFLRWTSRKQSLS